MAVSYRSLSLTLVCLELVARLSAARLVDLAVLCDLRRVRRLVQVAGVTEGRSDTLAVARALLVLLVVDLTPRRDSDGTGHTQRKKVSQG